MQKRMKSAHPRTPGGRFAGDSIASPSQSWKTGNFTPVRASKPAARKVSGSPITKSEPEKTA